MNEPTYIVAGCKPWNRFIFDTVISKFSGKWFYIGDENDLNLEKISILNPRYVFFLNWSWKVTDAIVKAYECVCFHPTDLPYGRGGSPIQNLILCGHNETKLTAFQMTPRLDEGPIYLKEDLSLEGRAEDIFKRFMNVAAMMIQKLILAQTKPSPQQGEAVTFKRRNPSQSAVPSGLSPMALYDFIRMLDAPGYPKAYIEREGVRFEFSNASLSDNGVTAQVFILTPKKSL